MSSRNNTLSGTLLLICLCFNFLLPSSDSFVPGISQGINTRSTSFQRKNQCSYNTNIIMKLNDNPQNIQTQSSMPSQHDGMEFPNLSIIGICGSIGSGKSFTSKLLVSKLNSLHNDDGDEERKEMKSKDGKDYDHPLAYHIDTDSLAHGVYTPGSVALEEIQAEFGPTVINEEDGTVNRKALGAIVFSDDQQMGVSQLNRYYRAVFRFSKAYDTCLIFCYATYDPLTRNLKK